MYLPTQDILRRYIQTIHVNSGEMVMFTNTSLHSGDMNNFKELSLRLFAYMASNLHDFPENKVMLYD
jgi:hypothetical protein